LPLNEIDKRREKFGATNLDRIELSENDFYNRVRNGYLEMCKTDSRFIVIDGTKTIEEIHLQIMNIITNLVKNE